jgi:hypothetical protein
LILAQSARHTERAGEALALGREFDVAADAFIQAGSMRLRSREFEPALNALSRGLELAAVERRDPEQLVEWLRSFSKIAEAARGASHDLN